MQSTNKKSKTHNFFDFVQKLIGLVVELNISFKKTRCTQTYKSNKYLCQILNSLVYFLKEVFFLFQIIPIGISLDFLVVFTVSYCMGSSGSVNIPENSDFGSHFAPH